MQAVQGALANPRVRASQAPALHSLAARLEAAASCARIVASESTTAAGVTTPAPAEEHAVPPGIFAASATASDAGSAAPAPADVLRAQLVAYRCLSRGEEPPPHILALACAPSPNPSPSSIPSSTTTVPSSSAAASAAVARDAASEAAMIAVGGGTERAARELRIAQRVALRANVLQQLPAHVMMSDDLRTKAR